MPDTLLNLDALRMFVAAAEHGSYLAAATALDTSRATIRRQVERLEAQLGATLLMRHADGVGLTESGLSFIHKAKAILGQAQQLLADVRESQPDTEQVIRLGLHVGYPVALASAINAALFARFPTTRIENVISECPMELLPDKVHGVFCIGEHRSSVVCAEIEVSTIPQRLYAHQEFLAKCGTPETLDDLGVIEGVWRDAMGDTKIHRRDGGYVDIATKFVTSDETYLRHLAEQGHGIVYAPYSPLPPNLLEGALVPVLPDTIGRDIRARFVVPEALAHLPRFRFLIELTRDMATRALQRASAKSDGTR